MRTHMYSTCMHTHTYTYMHALTDNCIYGTGRACIQHMYSCNTRQAETVACTKMDDHISPDDQRLLTQGSPDNTRNIDTMYIVCCVY